MRQTTCHCRDYGDVYLAVNEVALRNCLWSQFPTDVTVSFDEGTGEITIRFEDGDDR